MITEKTMIISTTIDLCYKKLQVLTQERHHVWVTCGSRAGSRVGSRAGSRAGSCAGSCAGAYSRGKYGEDELDKKKEQHSISKCLEQHPLKYLKYLIQSLIDR